MSHRSSNDKPVRVGIFGRVETADQVVERLLAEGFETEQVSVICSDPATGKHFAGIEGRHAGEAAPRRAAAGASIGAALGGLATLAGLATTGGGAVAMAGHLVSALASGGIMGGFIGAMTSRGVDQEAAEFYERSVEKGRILVVAEDAGDQGPRSCALRSGFSPKPVRNPFRCTPGERRRSVLPSIWF